MADFTTEVRAVVDAYDGSGGKEAWLEAGDGTKFNVWQEVQDLKRILAERDRRS